MKSLMREVVKVDFHPLLRGHGADIPFHRKIKNALPGNKTARAEYPIWHSFLSAFVSSSFEQTMLPHLDAAYNLARWLLRNEHDARDSVQDAYLRAFKAFSQFRGGDGKPWLLTIVRNVCYSKLRQNRSVEPANLFDENEHGHVDERAETAERLRREVTAELLNATMADLPEAMREIIVLHDLEGLSYREIATVVGIPLGTVMSRLARARLRLQRELLQRLAKEAHDEL
jgi:RNA polymerase sigma-70 factor (ECF subfamily)